jgi:hypothetical protein
MQTETARVFVACLLALSVVAAARAEDALPASPSPPAAATDDATQDPPSRVGRLSYVTGKVLMHPPGEGDWTTATRNYPVTTGETFWADQGALMEVQVAGAAIRIGGSTEVGVVTLDDNRIALGIPEGSVNIVVDKLADGAVVEATTPAGVVQIFATGRYHIDAGTASSPPRAQAFTGLARLIVSGSTLDVKDGEAGIVNGINPAVLVTQPAEPDELDKWAVEREQSVKVVARPKPRPKPAGEVGVAAEAQTEVSYVSEQIPGSYELTQSGQWDSVPDYGHVWYPSDVPTDWAPYRYGHWAFVPPWGWSWVDDAAWGFAPFHYGRWALIGSRWGWCPGEMVERPVYAPALVAFVGIGEVAGIGAGPAIGWIPLGPQEVYWPAYRVSAMYVRNVNVTNVTNVTNIVTVSHNATNDVHLNRNFMTAVHQGDFAASHPVQHAALTLPPSTVAKGPGPIIREPGLRPHLDVTAVIKPPAKIDEHPLAGTGHLGGPGHLATPNSLGVGTTVPRATLALPPPPKDAVHGGTSGRPAANTAIVGIAPPTPPKPQTNINPKVQTNLQTNNPKVQTNLQTNNPKIQTNLQTNNPKIAPAKTISRPQPPASAFIQPQKQALGVTQRVPTPPPPPQVKTPPGSTAIKAAVPVKPQLPAKPVPAPPPKNKDKKDTKNQ